MNKKKKVSKHDKKGEIKRILVRLKVFINETNETNETNLDRKTLFFPELPIDYKFI